VQVTLVDRSLMPGNVVRHLVEGCDSQRGYITDTYVRCHLRVLNQPVIICDVDTRDLLPFEVCTTQCVTCCMCALLNCRLVYWRIVTFLFF